jgi:hypothetical protein
MDVEFAIFPREGRTILKVDPLLLLANGVATPGNEYQAASAIAMQVSLLDDSPLARLGLKPKVVYTRELCLWVSRPLVELIKERASLSDKLLKGLSLYGSPDVELYQEFKRTPIFREYHEWCRQHDPKLLQFIHSYLVFTKKIKYEDDSFDATAFRSWQKIECDLTAWQVPNDRDTSDLKKIVGELCAQPLRLDAQGFKFGPGHVADLRGAVYGAPEKAKALTALPWKLRRLIYRDFPLEAVGKIVPFIGDDESRCGVFEAWYYSELKMVAKDVKTSRSISKERNTVMMFQQSLLRSVKRQFASGLMRHFVTLEDQSRSREAAMRGSEDGLSDTIDLSAASDRVHVDLIRAIFPVDWVIPLLYTRSSTVRTPVGVMRVKKFAPMGSALCFPIQCVIFTSICLLAYAKGLGIDLDGGSIVRKVVARCGDHTSLRQNYDLLHPIVIYGDDIVSDTRFTPDVVALLTKFGFQVNRDKSFEGGNAVREACGIYAWSGFDITPIRYSLTLRRSATIDPAYYAGLISLANRAYDFGYLNLRRTIIRLTRQGLGSRARFIPFTNDRDEFGVYTDGKINHQTTRYHKGYQRREVKVLVVRSIQENPDSLKTYEASAGTFSRINFRLEGYLYYRHLCRTSDPAPARRHHVITWLDEEERSVGRERPLDLRYSWRWTPTN